MAKRLTDKERKKILADYIQCQNYREVGRKHKIADITVKRIVGREPDTLQKVAQKAEENTHDTLTYIQQQHEQKRRIASKLLTAIETKAETTDMFTNIRDLTTAYGIIIDKELKFAEIQAAQHKGENQYYIDLPARTIGKAYADINRDIDARRHRFYDFKGGRGSLKSSYCGLKIIDLMMKNENFCGLAVRQIKDTLKDSVYAQIVWAIDELCLNEYFHCTKNPMEIRRKDTGQIIYFRGGDEPGKIKSIRPPNGMHIGVAWFEECDQIHGEEAMRNILQSIMRGSDDITVFRSYNTPISQKHFINEDARKNRPNRLIHHSHYNDAPQEWLGESFYELAEELKASNPKAYAHEYDGEATGTGLNVFENITLRPITDKELETFDRIYYGLDFGYFPDAAHFGEMYFNSHQRKLYIYREIRKLKMRNEDLAKELDAWRTVKITADSAESKSIADFQAWGFQMYGAIKGPGSIEYGIKWLQSLNEIIIDPSRCPYTADEFTTYEYLKDKEGQPITGYPDENNHSIDMVRYALEEVWRRRGQ